MGAERPVACHAWTKAARKNARVTTIAAQADTSEIRPRQIGATAQQELTNVIVLGAGVRTHLGDRVLDLELLTLELGNPHIVWDGTSQFPVYLVFDFPVSGLQLFQMGR